MATRQHRLSEFDQGLPPSNRPLEPLCEDHSGTYLLPYPCHWIDGVWRNSVVEKIIEGKRDLAGKSVAVPFVGMSAASLAVAEAVRPLHDGPAYIDIKLGLGNPDKRFARRNGSYTAQDAAGLTFIRAKQYRTPKIHESRFLHRDPENVFFCPE
jgi:hypothetical protein